MTPDPTNWSLWWGFHRPGFLQLRRSLQTRSLATGSDDFYLGGVRRDDATARIDPTHALFERDVVPRLLALVSSCGENKVVSSTMVALAQIDIDDRDKRLLPLLLQKLPSHDQEVRETAALALGITEHPHALAVLIDLFLDSSRGRELVQRVRVDFRTRAFAGYGIGLVAGGTTDPALARLAVMALERLLQDHGEQNRDVLVAAIAGLRQVRLPAVREHVLRPLRAFYEREIGTGDEVVLAHVPPALAALLGRGGDKTGEVTGRLVVELDDQTTRRTNLLRQSAAIALGELCGTTPADVRHRDALWNYVQRGKDAQTRAYCLIALARIGGETDRTSLLSRLRTANTHERPWVALALGVLAHAERAHAIDASIGRELHAAMLDTRNPDVVAAAAIGLGLSGWQSAAPDLRALLDRNRAREDLTVHLCTALALLEDHAAIPLLQEVLAANVRRPEILVHAASALGRLGHHAVAGELARMLQEGDCAIATVGGLATAIGLVGDRRCVAPLLAVLARNEVPALGRAYAIHGLGQLGDSDDLPRGSQIAHFVNYRAVVETLTDQVSGVLDILW